MYKLILIPFLYMSCIGLLTSCQYHFGYGDLADRYSTISIPYAQGDEEGELTTEVIRAISTSGTLRYTPCGGDLTLQMRIIEVRDENIGYRYDRNKKGHLKNGLLPAETRLNAIVEIKIVERSTDKILRGPVQVFASVDFDHDYYYSRNAINIFSLGQLSDIDDAEEAAMHPLNRKLAEKISNYITNSW